MLQCNLRRAAQRPDQRLSLQRQSASWQH